MSKKRHVVVQPPETPSKMFQVRVYDSAAEKSETYEVAADIGLLDEDFEEAIKRYRTATRKDGHDRRIELVCVLKSVNIYEEKL